MKNTFPIVAAVELVLLWLVMLYAIPQTLGMLADFKIEMPVLTRAVLWVSQLFGGMVLPFLVLATALLLGFRQFVGWVYALVLCIAWDLAFVGLLLQIFVLIDNLSGGTFVSWLSIFTSLIPLIVSIEGAVVISLLILNQVLFVSLVVKRRDFAR